MKRWSYIEPGPDWEPIKITMTEEEILRLYYPMWSDKMRAVGKADQISDQNCIEDWVVVNWACEEPDDELSRVRD